MKFKQLALFMLCLLVLATFNTAEETSLESITISLEPMPLRNESINATNQFQQENAGTQYYPLRLQQILDNYAQRNYLVTSAEAASLPQFEMINEGHYLVYVIAGKTTSLSLMGSDPDRDIGPAGKFIWVYVEPFSSNGQWATDLNDVGVHDTLVTLSDGELHDYLRITVLVLRQNDPPQLTPVPDMTVTAGEFVTVNVMAKDPDNDALKASVAGFMSSNPYRTSADEVGEHIALVTVSDGFYRVTQNVHVFVVERPEEPKDYTERIYIVDTDRKPMNLVDYVIDRPRNTNQTLRTVEYVVDSERQQSDVQVPKETSLIDYIIWHKRQPVPTDALTADQQQTMVVYT